MTAFTITNAVAGQQYCFAVASYSRRSKVRGPVPFAAHQPVSIADQPWQPHLDGRRSATLQLTGSGPDRQPLTYRSGMPPGLLLMAATGFISGTPTTAGNYAVAATAPITSCSSRHSHSRGRFRRGRRATARHPRFPLAVPTSASSYSSSASAITVGGTAADNVGVSTVTWHNSRVAAEPPMVRRAGSVPFVGLQLGSNVITVTARDCRWQCRHGRFDRHSHCTRRHSADYRDQHADDCAHDDDDAIQPDSRGHRIGQRWGDASQLGQQPGRLGHGDWHDELAHRV